MRAQALAMSLALVVSPSSGAVDWLGTFERAELYSSLIVGAKSQATEQALLRAAFYDPEVSPRAYQALRLDAARNWPSQ